jgi:hypothetical protein
VTFGCYGTCGVSADLSALAAQESRDETLDELHNKLIDENEAELARLAPALADAVKGAVGGIPEGIRDPLIRAACVALRDAAHNEAWAEANRRVGTLSTRKAA